MQIGLADLQYIPFIFLRPAELGALEKLHHSEKDLIIPYFNLKPWANSSSLSNSIKKIESVFSDRNYFLGPDRYYKRASSHSSAAKEFNSIISGKADELNVWWEVVSSSEFIIPEVPSCKSSSELAEQIKIANSFGRGFAIRVSPNSKHSVGNYILALLDAEIDHNEFLVCLDVGWGLDLLEMQVWLAAQIEQIVANFPLVRIVISGSSFPRSFSKFDQFGTSEIVERELFEQTVQRHNNANLIYGDWASSRPPSEQGGGKLVKRLDIAHPSRWDFFRAGDESQDYVALAKSVVSTQFWHDSYDPEVWGMYLVQSASEGVPSSIGSAKRAAEARINMHLHQQISRHTGSGAAYVEQRFED